MAELVRIFHDLTLEEAQEAVEALVTRRHPLVWGVDDIKRVLDPSLKKADQVLLLLYSESGWTDIEKLRNWVEYANKTEFKSKVLATLHASRLIENSPKEGVARLTTKGIAEVERKLVQRVRPSDE